MSNAHLSYMIISSFEFICFNPLVDISQVFSGRVTLWKYTLWWWCNKWDNQMKERKKSKTSWGELKIKGHSHTWFQNKRRDILSTDHKWLDEKFIPDSHDLNMNQFEFLGYKRRESPIIGFNRWLPNHKNRKERREINGGEWFSVN